MTAPSPRDAILSTRPDRHFRQIIALLKKAVRQLKTPIVGVIAQTTKDPFCVLISCLLSLRTKDATTEAASRRLFALATTPLAMQRLTREQIASAIYPVSFYRNKAGQILGICKILMDQYQGQVPSQMERLLALPGVGRKTANLVITEGFNRPGICVDTHVHRISNRLGLIKTKTPDESEMALRKVLPKPYWKGYNGLLVPYGQYLCTPVSPFCSRCTIAHLCKRIGVTKYR